MILHFYLSRKSFAFRDFLFVMRTFRFVLTSGVRDLQNELWSIS